MTEHVVVLGAGFGGLELSTRLSELAPRDVRVTLIDRSDSFVFGFSKLDVMFGKATTDSVKLRYSDVGAPGVTFVRDEITSIDPAARRVETAGGSHDADFLVVALGADYDIDATPGLAEGGYEFYTLAGAERLREVLPSFDGGTVLIGILGTPYKCPPAPYEAAFLLHEQLTTRGIRERSEIHVISPLPSPVPVSAETTGAILRELTERSIAFTPEDVVTELDPLNRTAVLRSGSGLAYDLFLAVPVHVAPEVVVSAGLTEDGWIPVDQRSLRTRFEGVYAIGDVASAPVPRAGVFAESAARTVAEDIAARLRGAALEHPYSGAGNCYIEFGDGLVGRVDADFLSGPTPKGPFTGPSRDLAAEKGRFGAERRARWFGRG